jgi:hypothetical protein
VGSGDVLNLRKIVQDKGCDLHRGIDPQFGIGTFAQRANRVVRNAKGDGGAGYADTLNQHVTDFGFAIGQARELADLTFLEGRHALLRRKVKGFRPDDAVALSDEFMREGENGA